MLGDAATRCANRISPAEKRIGEDMTTSSDPTRRRQFLANLAVLGAGTALAGCAHLSGSAASGSRSGAEQAKGGEAGESEKEKTAPPRGGQTAGQEKEDVGPAEDLMREHGVLNRILLIYDDSIRRLDSGADLPVEVVASAAGIIRHFIEEYHEKLEEDHLFPRFEKAGKLVDLVHTLRTQHAAGRTVTAKILALAKPEGIAAAAGRGQLSSHLRRFIRMYRPHEAREDTVLFPALHDLITPAEYDQLGDQFEDKEHELFGARGFEGVVDEVADLEKRLGIYDLAQFTA